MSGRIKSLYFVFLFTLVGLAGTSFAYTYTWVYKPDKSFPFGYWNKYTWSDELVPYASGGSAGANRSSGIPLKAAPGEHNIDYLRTKKNRFGHLLDEDL